MTIHLPHPLGGPPPLEIMLSQAPLASVVAQVRFPTVLIIGDKAKVAPFQDELRSAYPIFRQETGQALHVEITPGGPMVQSQATVLWRFADAANDWTVTLAVDAITLETRRYVSRADFLARLSDVLGAMERAFTPSFAERLGMRYITRVTGEGYERFDEMVRSELLGVAIPELRSAVRHAISEASMSVEEGDLSLRWGVMPPNGTFDPSILPGIAESSWFLDIDVSTQGQQRFETQTLGRHFDAFAQRAYAVFRYAITEQFLTLYGGKQ